MKRESNSRMPNLENYDELSMDDTRYYGVYKKGRGEDAYVLVDPKRYQKQFPSSITPQMAQAMKNQKYSRFCPAKKRRDGYHVNFMIDELYRIRCEWKNTYKPMKDIILSKIVGINYNENPWDDELAMCGILDSDEVSINAAMKTIISAGLAQEKRLHVNCSLYSQYFQQIASQVEALFIRTLVRSRKDYTGEKFNRNDIYLFDGKEQEARIRLLPGHKEFDKLYSIWAFLKHNNLSSYEKVHDKFPEVLTNDEYKSGKLALYFINFDDALIESIFDGLKTFFKEYCALVYDEDAEMASWNSSEYFLCTVYAEINEYSDPFGLSLCL
jgi:hypothetical protein